MTCGCTCPSPLPTVDRRTAAMVCHFCHLAEHDAVSAWVVGAVRCTVSGRPISEHVMAVGCPLGYHPTVARPVVGGVVVDWHGLPMWKRWALWAAHPKHPKPSSFPGCGCIRWLKDFWSLGFVPTLPERPTMLGHVTESAR